MYNKFSAKYHKKNNLNYDEEEPPRKKLVTHADLFIKELGEKQRNTKTNLQELLAMKKKFYKANEFKSLTSYVSGSTSLQEFNEVVKSSEEIEKFKSFGLTDSDIELYHDYQRGEEYFLRKHNNMNKNIMKERLNHICKQVSHISDESRRCNELSRLETELLSSEKPTSMETKLYKFALENQRNSKEKLPHPMDNLKHIEQQFSQDLESVNIKKIRRKARSLQRQIDEIQTVQVVESKINKAGGTLSENSKWDLKESSSQSSQNDVLCSEKNLKKVYTCTPQNYYTIKDNQIIKIHPPDNKKEITKRLTLEEIKKIAKFENYTTGKPSSMLYLKNIANRTTEDDLKTVLREFSDEKIFSIKIMKGQMKGQAFIQMRDEKSAEIFLNQCNGILLKNKPIIIHFGKNKKANT